MGIMSGSLKLFKGFFRLLAYPVIRPLEGIMQSGKRIQGDVRGYRDLRARKAAQAQADQASAIEGANLASMNAKDKFEALVVANAWTKAELAKQMRAVRRTKFFSICGGLSGSVLAIASMWAVPVWTLMIIAPAAALFVIMAIIRTLQFGLFQAQLEQRSLIRLTDYLGRRDLFSHLFS
jgi:hypothetical protein